MGRLKRASSGFTLLELVIASTLAFIVILAASNLLINFGRFTSTTIRAEATLMDAALAAVEDVVACINGANAVSIIPDGQLAARPAGCVGSSCIQVRTDQKMPLGCVGNNCSYSPTDFTNDVVHTYWREFLNNNWAIRYSSRNLVNNTTVGPISLADRGITSLSFARNAADRNKITITLIVQAASGPSGALSTENLVTTATMRGATG